jgi:hypothetical protein
MTVTSDSSPLPIIETIPLGDHLPTSERDVYKRNPVIDVIIDFSGGTAGQCKSCIQVYCSNINVLASYLHKSRSCKLTNDFVEKMNHLMEEA